MNIHIQYIYIYYKYQAGSVFLRTFSKDNYNAFIAIFHCSSDCIYIIRWCLTQIYRESMPFPPSGLECLNFKDSLKGL